jgi:hypothetical protein
VRGVPRPPGLGAPGLGAADGAPPGPLGPPGPPGPTGAGRGPGRGAPGPRSAGWAGGSPGRAEGASENDTGTGGGVVTPGRGSGAAGCSSAAGTAGAWDGGAAASAGAGDGGAGLGAGAVRLPFCPSAVATVGASAWGRACGLRAWPCFGACAENASLSLRTTGASIVEDAERTNSPISWSLAITALLSTPNSFASSYTRTFATALPLIGPAYARPWWRRPGQRVLRPASDSAVHRRVLIRRSSRSDPAFFGNAVLVAAPAGWPGQTCTALFAALCQVLSEPAGDGWSRQAQRPGERPAPLCLLEAFLAEVQVGAAAMQPRLGVRDEFALPAHHTQQVGLGLAAPAPDACPDRGPGPRRPLGPSDHSGR